MAAPLEVNTLNLSGTYVMNKDLSGDMNEILRVQGVSWKARKLISFVTITLYIKHFKDEQGIEHIAIDQVGPKGHSGNSEERLLDWKEQSADESAFGPVVKKSRRVSVKDIQNTWQREGWLPDTIDHGLVEVVVRSDTEKSGKVWTIDTVWGFAIIDGARRHIRKVHLTAKDEKDISAVLVYDYQGPNTRS